jgi:hypothetical protein
MAAKKVIIKGVIYRALHRFAKCKEVLTLIAEIPPIHLS